MNFFKETKKLHVKRSEKKMKEDYDDFYAENEEFVNDIREYYSNIRTEFIHIINEVSGYKMVCEFIGIGMIPYKPGTNGVLLDDKKNLANVSQVLFKSF